MEKVARIYLRGEGKLMRKRRALSSMWCGLVLALGACAGPVSESDLRPTSASNDPLATVVFASGEAGYDTFRIPAIVKAKSGVLLAFAEGRINSSADYGDIDLVLRRSFDNGATWGPLQVVAEGNGKTKGNPVPIVQSSTGKIILVTTQNDVTGTNQPIHATRRPYVQVSTDEGASWSTEKALPEATKRDYWRQYYTGPGHGLELQRGRYAGRLIVPASNIWGYDHPDGLRFGAHVLYSDDGGETWELGAVDDTSSAKFINPVETSAVELTNGTLYFTARDDKGLAAGHRAEALSRDGGLSFTRSFTSRPDIVTPVVQGVVLRFQAKDRGNARKRLLLAAPAHPAAREIMSIRSSFDEGKTWNTGKVIDWGPSAYSDMTLTADGAVGLLYENGDYDPYDRITFVKLSEAYLDTPNVKPVTPPEVAPSDPRTPDSSGNTDGAALKGTPELVAGVAGQALALDGSVDHLIVPFSEAIDVAGEAFSLSLWFRYQETQGAHALAWAYRLGCCSTPQFWLRAEPANNRLQGYMNTAVGSVSLSSPTAYNDGQWHHAVLSRSQTSFSIFIDGEQVAAKPALPGSLTEGQEYFIQGLHVGQRADGANRLRGALDDVRLYDRALSAQEVQALYQNPELEPKPERLWLELDTFQEVNPTDFSRTAAARR